MAFRYWYEFAVGIITLIALLIFGEKGFFDFNSRNAVNYEE